MSWKTAKLIFYLGTLVSLLLFLGLTVDTHRQVETLTNADRLSPEVVAGKRVWHKYNCNDCHTILGFGSYYAPDMTKAYWRLGGEGIKAVVRNPEKFTTWRKMPRIPITEKELEDLAAFLKWTSEIDTNEWPPQDQKLRPAARRAVALGLSPGATLFQEKGCFACHRLNETGGLLGPDLTRVGARLPYETIEKVLVDPRSVKPDGIMPPAPLSREETQALAKFLAEMK
ncbi:MAG TPA: cytochrome c [Candidatus Binatia bacterium]|jgi:nitric oxide reductase subunit C